MPLLKSLAATVVALSATLASASPTVLDFNAATTGFGFGSLTEDGYTVSGSGNYFVSSGGSRYCAPACPDNGSNNLLAQGGSFTVSAVNGAAFSLTGFDGAEAHMTMPQLWAQQIRVTGNQVGGGTVVSDFALDFIQDGPGAAVDFQRFVLGSGFDNLASVVFSGIGGTRNWFTLDNITLDTAAATVLRPSLLIAPVPEPGSLLLAAVALVGLVGSRRQPRPLPR